jgi:hypothetical protein
MYDDDQYVIAEDEAREGAELLKNLEHEGSLQDAAELDQVLSDFNTDELEALGDQSEEIVQEPSAIECSIAQDAVPDLDEWQKSGFTLLGALPPAERTSMQAALNLRLDPARLRALPAPQRCLERIPAGKHYIDDRIGLKEQT